MHNHFIGHSLTVRDRSSKTPRLLAVFGILAVGLFTANAGWGQTPIPIAPVVYLAKFTCGSQRDVAISLQLPLEQGRYATSFGVFNPSARGLRNVTVSASVPGQTAIPVESYTLPAFGTETTDCSEILSALNLIGTPDAVVGFLYAARLAEDLDVQVAYTRTVGAGTNGDGEIGGAGIDIERIEPRPYQAGRF